MYRTLVYVIALILYMFNGCNTLYDPILGMIVVEEFGERKKLDKQSYLAYDFLESNVSYLEYPISRLNDTGEWKDPEYVFLNNYTYVRVEYINPMSPMEALEVDYNETEMIVYFMVEKPYVRVPFAIAGYSLIKRINLLKE